MPYGSGPDGFDSGAGSDFTATLNTKSVSARRAPITSLYNSIRADDEVGNLASLLVG
jgi:hypothetical protein